MWLTNSADIFTIKPDCYVAGNVYLQQCRRVNVAEADCDHEMLQSGFVHKVSNRH